MNGYRDVNVAVGQLAARPLEEADDALDAVFDAISRAGRLGVGLLVLPECAYPAYHLGSPARYRSAPLLGSEALVQRLSAATRETGLHLVIGLVEPDAGRLYNAALLIGPDGRCLGSYRKQFLWDYDHDYFTPGASIDVVETAIGRIGMLICADARAPEIVATLAGRGAELVAMPTNWVNTARRPGEFYNPQPDFLIPARCREFGLPFLCANKSGQEDDETRFCGLSCIVLPDGSTAAQAGPTEQGVIAAELAVGPPGMASIPPACRDRLLADRSAEAPPCDRRRIGLCVVRSRDDLDRLLNDRKGIAVVSESLDDPGPPAPGESSSMRVVPRPRAPGLTMLDGVSIGCAVGADADGFAWPRVLALDGAEIICLFDHPADLRILRTRAVENRVFVAAITHEWVALIGPDATVLGQDARVAVAEVDVADAADKTVAPQTDIFAERRPASYEL